MNYREAAVAAVECSATGGPNQPVQTGKNNIAAAVFGLVTLRGHKVLFLVFIRSIGVADNNKMRQIS